MKNEEKYKTTFERRKAFYVFCRSQRCYSCPCYEPGKHHGMNCVLRWLGLESDSAYDALFTVEPYGKMFRVLCDKEEVFTMAMESAAREICAKLNSIARKWHKRLCEKGETK